MSHNRSLSLRSLLFPSESHAHEVVANFFGFRQLRRLTLLDRLRIASFPFGVCWVGNLSQCWLLRRDRSAVRSLVSFASTKIAVQRFGLQLTIQRTDSFVLLHCVEFHSRMDGFRIQSITSSIPVEALLIHLSVLVQIALQGALQEILLPHLTLRFGSIRVVADIHFGQVCHCNSFIPLWYQSRKEDQSMLPSCLPRLPAVLRQMSPWF